MAYALNKDEHWAMGRHADTNYIYGRDGRAYPHQLERSHVTQYQAAPTKTAAAAATAQGVNAPMHTCRLLVLVVIAGLLIATGVSVGLVLPTVFNMPAMSSTSVASTSSASPPSTVAVITTASPAAATVSDSAISASVVITTTASNNATASANGTLTSG